MKKEIQISAAGNVEIPAHLSIKEKAIKLTGSADQPMHLLSIGFFVTN